MKPKDLVLILGPTVAVLTVIGLATIGQGDWWGGSNPYRGYNNAYDDYLQTLLLIRVGMMILASALGFAIGWLISPEARGFRQFIFLILAVVALWLAIFNHGMLGWGTAFAVSVIGFFTALGYWGARFVKTLAEVPTTHGSSKWATPAHLKERGFFKKGGLLLGAFYDGEHNSRIYYHGEQHLLTIAATRGGKGVSHIVPNALTYPGSMVIIDPKGENALITAKARMAMGQEVCIVDPWNIVAGKLGLEPARYNPLGWLEMDDVDAPENAMILADALIVSEGSSDPFWREEAKALVQGVMLQAAFDKAYEGRQTLGTVRDLLLGDGEELMKLFGTMAKSPHRLIASTGSRCLQKEPKLLSNVLASTQAELHMMDSARLRAATAESDFRFEDLKAKPMTIYIVIPADRIAAFKRFLRVMVEQSLTMNARNIEEKPKYPVLYILDEMPALGRLNMVEQAYGLMAGYSVQLWGIAQNVSQLKAIYGESFETFIANAGAVCYFGTKDKASADYFSDLCGVTTVWNLSSAISTAISRTLGNGGGGSDSRSETDTRSATQRKLAYPDELMRLNDRQQLLLIGDADPIMARKLRWFEQPDMLGKGQSLR